MADIEKHIATLKEKGFDLSLNSIIKESFNHWKKIVIFGIFSIIFTYSFSNIISLFISRAMGTGILDLKFQEAVSPLLGKPENYQKLTGIFLEYINNPLIIKKTLLVSLIGLLVYPMQAGVVYCAYKFDKKGIATFKNLIKGFQGNRFINLLGLGLISYLIIIVSAFLLFIPALYLIPATILAGAFIVIDNVSLFKALKYSIQIVNIRFGQFLPILIASFFISRVLGILLCGIGIILTLPFAYAIVYSLYKNTIGNLKQSNTE